MLKRFIVPALFFALCTAQAQDRTRSNLATNEISGEMELVSQYVERGVNLSDNNPAMHASFLFNLGSQVRMGVWGSNVSYLTRPDDNFWAKILAEFNVIFANNLNAKFYVSDDHYYKSNVLNGQHLGAAFTWNVWDFGFDWMSNLEGTHSNGEYLYGGRYFMWGNKIRYGGNLGYTASSSPAISGYFDGKIYVKYILNANTSFEGAFAMNFSPSQFGKRGDPAVYGGVKLSY